MFKSFLKRRTRKLILSTILLTTFMSGFNVTTYADEIYYNSDGVPYSIETDATGHDELSKLLESNGNGADTSEDFSDDQQLYPNQNEETVTPDEFDEFAASLGDAIQNAVPVSASEDSIIHEDELANKVFCVIKPAIDPDDDPVAKFKQDVKDRGQDNVTYYALLANDNLHTDFGNGQVYQYKVKDINDVQITLVVTQYNSNDYVLNVDGQGYPIFIPKDPSKTKGYYFYYNSRNKKYEISRVTIQSGIYTNPMHYRDIRRHFVMWGEIKNEMEEVSDRPGPDDPSQSENTIPRDMKGSLFLNLAARLAAGEDLGEQIGSSPEDLGYAGEPNPERNFDIDSENTSDWEHTATDFDAADDFETYQAMLMNMKAFGGGSKLHVGSSKIHNMLVSDSPIYGTETINIRIDDNIVTRELDETENNDSLASRAATNYARLAELTRAIDDSSYEPKDIDKWYDDLSSIGLDTYKYMDMPIMITKDGFGSGHYADKDADADLLWKLNVTIAEWGAITTEYKDSLDEEPSDADKQIVSDLSAAVNTFGNLYPAIRSAWQYGNHSMEDINDVSSYNDVNHPQPLTMFFTTHVLGLLNDVTGINDPWRWFQKQDNCNNPVVLSDYMKQGIAESAMYVPLQTNVYDMNTLYNMDESLRKDFHYKYGFMRKALMIDKSATAVQDYYNMSGTQRGTTKVCTLRDLFDAAKNDQEVLLYVDDNFYNMKNLEDATSPRTNQHANNIAQSCELAQRAIDDVLGRDVTTDTTSQGTGTTETVSGNVETSGGQGNKNLLQRFLTFTGLDTVLSEAASSVLGISEELLGLKGTYAHIDDRTMKTNGYTTYDAMLRSNITSVLGTILMGGDYIDADEDKLGKNNPDNYVFSSYDIKDVLDGVTVRRERNYDSADTDYEYTTYDPYTPALGYAYVSAIYRNEQLFALLQDSSNYSPVFMASEKLAELGMEDSEMSNIFKNTIYNYALLKNLESMSQVTYTYSLDMESPLYMDVYGNIITASGVVIIPALSNATLWDADWSSAQPAIGLYTCYGNNYRIPASIDYDGLNATFQIDPDGNYWVPLNRMIIDDNTGDSINYAGLAEYDTSAQAVARAKGREMLQTNSHINWWAYVSIISEVMRGAPIEQINLFDENLNSSDVNAEGLVIAAKLDKLIESTSGTMDQNNLFVIPDFTRMDHVEYFLAFVIKIMAVATVGVCCLLVYRDASAGELGLRTILKTLAAVAATCLVITGVPSIFQLTYYGANKFLLQDEAERIAMYSTEKYQSGVEVGITETTVPTNRNDLMVQLDWVNVPWYNYVKEMIYGQGLEQMLELKEEAYRSSLVAHQDDVQRYNDGIYMSVTDIFNSASIDFSFGKKVTNMNEDEEETVTVSDNEAEVSSAPPVSDDADNNTDSSDDNGGDGGDDSSEDGQEDTDVLTENTYDLYLKNNNDNQTLSYYSPYYVFLKALVSNINEYNFSTGTYKFTTKYMSGSRPKTVGLSEAYFTSTYFMEDCTDILHLYNVTGAVPDVPEPYDYALFSEDDTELMHKSLWYVANMDKYQVDKRINMMNMYARDFIARNKDLLNKMSDETFIKTMALSLAMKWNQIYGISEANCFELYNLDANDLMRLCICKSDEAMIASPMSYSRYIYTYGGEFGLYAGLFLYIVMLVGSFIKPLCTIIVFVSVFASIFVFKILLRRETSFMGYLITCFLLCIMNVVHAMLLKFSTCFPDMGLPTSLCLIIMAFIQILYLILLGGVAARTLADWQDLGTESYKQKIRKAQSIMHGEDTKLMTANVPIYEGKWDYYNEYVHQYHDRY